MFPVVSRPTRLYRDTRNGSGSHYKVQSGRSAQKAPYNVRTSYYMESCDVISAQEFNWPDFSGMANAYAPKAYGLPGNGFGGGRLQEKEWALNKARESFLSKINAEAMLAVNWAERSQAVSMLAKRADQLVRFTDSLRRRDLSGVARSLGLPISRIPDKVKRRTRDPRDRYHHPRALANTWLEYHFGWDPLIKDIYSAVDILQKPTPSRSISGAGSIPFQDNLIIGGAPVYSYIRTVSNTGVVRARVSGLVRVSNPNLWKANQLGLLNPASVAWELIPYSFVVDWFTNVSAFLAQYTDTLGLSIDASTVTACHQTSTYTDIDWSTGIDRSFTVQYAGSWYNRQPGFPGVTLGFKPRRPLGVIRGATAISLLLQKMPRVG